MTDVAVKGRVPVVATILVALAVAGMIALGAWQLGPVRAERIVAAKALAMSEVLQSDQAGVRRRTRALAVPAAVEVAPDLTGFSRQLHESAGRNGVQVVRLTPRPREPEVLEIELISSFPAFLRFSADLELRSAILREPKLARPGVVEVGSDRLAISLLVEVPRRHAIAGAHGMSVVVAALDARMRDPFAAPTGVLKDLSTMHRLTGVTLAKINSATIEGADYEPGDAFGDMTVTSVGEDEVFLSKGKDRFVIRFNIRHGG